MMTQSCLLVIPGIVLGRAAMSGAPELRGDGDDAEKRPRHPGRVALADEESRLALDDRFGNSGVASADDGQALGHRFLDGGGQALLVAGVRIGQTVLDEHAAFAEEASLRL